MSADLLRCMKNPCAWCDQNRPPDHIRKALYALL
jgi:hypothetical protein